MLCISPIRAAAVTVRMYLVPQHITSRTKIPCHGCKGTETVQDGFELPMLVKGFKLRVQGCSSDGRGFETGFPEDCSQKNSAIKAETPQALFCYRCGSSRPWCGVSSRCRRKFQFSEGRSFLKKKPVTITHNCGSRRLISLSIEKLLQWSHSSSWFDKRSLACFPSWLLFFSCIKG